MRTNHDLFSLFHAESECFLAASCNRTKSLPALPIPKSYAALSQQDLLLASLPPPTSAPGAHPAYLRPMAAASPAAEENYSAKSLFVFDYWSNRTCQKVGWEAAVRIRHVATDK